MHTSNNMKESTPTMEHSLFSKNCLGAWHFKYADYMMKCPYTDNDLASGAYISLRSPRAGMAIMTSLC